MRTQQPNVLKAGRRPPKTASPRSARGADSNEPVLSTTQLQVISEITRLHGEVREAIRLTAVKAVELGCRLEALKNEVGRGRWLLFVKENLPFCARTAERYMDVFANREKLEKYDTMSNFKVTDAYRFLAGGKKSSADPEENTEKGEAQAVIDKNTIITALTRSLCDGLEKLGPDKLKRFEADLLEFKQSWLEQHAREVEK